MEIEQRDVGNLKSQECKSCANNNNRCSLLTLQGKLDFGDCPRKKHLTKKESQPTWLRFKREIAVCGTPVKLVPKAQLSSCKLRARCKLAFRQHSLCPKNSQEGEIEGKLREATQSINTSSTHNNINHLVIQGIGVGRGGSRVLITSIPQILGISELQIVESGRHNLQCQEYRGYQVAISTWSKLGQPLDMFDVTPISTDVTFPRIS